MLLLLDSEIIAALKSHYRRRQVNLALENSQQESKKFYDVNQLTTLKWMKQICEELREETMFNCWCNTCLIASSISVLENSELEAKFEIEEILTHLFNALPFHLHSTINELLISNEQDLSAFKIRASSHLKFSTVTFNKILFYRKQFLLY